MDPGTAHSLFQALRGDRSTFVYSGEFRDEHTARLIALGEASMDGANARSSSKGRLAFVMVEAYQNIIRHKAPLPPQLEQAQGRSMFILRCGDNGQHVVAMNAVVKSEVPALRATLDSLKGLSAEELKSLFLAGLQKPENSARRGAGLGLIEMARRSGSDLGYMHRGLGADRRTARSWPCAWAMVSRTMRSFPWVPFSTAWWCNTGCCCFTPECPRPG